MWYYVQRPYIRQNLNFHTAKVFRYTVQRKHSKPLRYFSEFLYPAITTFKFTCSCPACLLVVMSQPLRGFDGIAISLDWQLSSRSWLNKWGKVIQ